jgi:hypothetical protein
LSGISGASPREIIKDETNIASYKCDFFTRPLGFQVSEAISIKNGVVDGVGWQKIGWCEGGNGHVRRAKHSV